MEQSKNKDEEVKIGLVKSLLRYLVQGVDKEEDIDQKTSQEKIFKRIRDPKEKHSHDYTTNMQFRLDDKSVKLLRTYKETTGVTLQAICGPIIKKFLQMHRGSLEESLPLCRDENDVEKLIVELYNIPLVC